MIDLNYYFVKALRGPIIFWKLNMWPASWKCSEEAFVHFVKSKDPLKLGWVVLFVFQCKDTFAFDDFVFSKAGLWNLQVSKSQCYAFGTPTTTLESCKSKLCWLWNWFMTVKSVAFIGLVNGIAFRLCLMLAFSVF